MRRYRGLTWRSRHHLLVPQVRFVLASGFLAFLSSRPLAFLSSCPLAFLSSHFLAFFCLTWSSTRRLRRFSRFGLLVGVLCCRAALLFTASCRTRRCSLRRIITGDVARFGAPKGAPKGVLFPVDMNPRPGVAPAITPSGRRLCVYHFPQRNERTWPLVFGATGRRPFDVALWSCAGDLRLISTHFLSAMHRGRSLRSPAAVGPDRCPLSSSLSIVPGVSERAAPSSERPS